MTTAAERAAAKQAEKEAAAAAVEQEAADVAASLSTVMCVSQHSVDLDGGRTLASGDDATIDVLGSEHNRSLVLDGHLLVTDGPVPRVRTLAEDDNEEDN